MSKYMETNTLWYIEVNDHPTLTINVVKLKDVWEAFRVDPLVIF